MSASTATLTLMFGPVTAQWGRVGFHMRWLHGCLRKVLPVLPRSHRRRRLLPPQISTRRLHRQHMARAHRPLRVSCSCLFKRMKQQACFIRFGSTTRNPGNIEFVTKIYDNLVVKAAEFLEDYRDPATHLPKPTFDEWEEKSRRFHFDRCIGKCGSGCSI